MSEGFLSDSSASIVESALHPGIWVRIEGFLRQRSSGTQKTYLGIIKEWCEFLGVEPGSSEAANALVSVSDIDAMRYRSWLEKRPGQPPRLKTTTTETLPVKSSAKAKTRDGTQATLTNATIRKKFSALRRIYRMLIANFEQIKHNPFDVDRVPPPRQGSGQKRPTEMVPFELVQNIVNQPDLKRPAGIRDRALLALLFGGGLRRSEAANIRIGDVRETGKGTLFVQLRNTKSGKDAMQALPEWTRPLVMELLDQRIEQGAESGSYLLVSYRGRGAKKATEHPLSDNGIYRLFKRYTKLAGAGDHLSPHSARATAITRLLELGIPHRDVREFSRHSSVQMVELYDKRRTSIDQSPANKLEY